MRYWSINKTILTLAVLTVVLGVLNAVQRLRADRVQQTVDYTEVVTEIERINEELDTITPDTSTSLNDALRILRE